MIFDLNLSQSFEVNARRLTNLSDECYTLNEHLQSSLTVMGKWDFQVLEIQF